VDAVKFAVEEEDSPRATAADLAMLFADCESVRRPATLGTVVTGGSDTRTEASRPRKTVSQKLGFTGLKSFAGKTKTNKEKVEQVPESTADASGRAELFRVGSGGESGASGSSGAPRMSSADEIRAKYGKSKPTDNGTSGAGRRSPVIYTKRGINLQSAGKSSRRCRTKRSRCKATPKTSTPWRRNWRNNRKAGGDVNGRDVNRKGWWVSMTRYR